MTLCAAIRADHGLLHESRLRYDDRYEAASDTTPHVADSEQAAGWCAIAGDLITNVGFQQLAAFRVASALHQRGLTPLAMLVGRAIRHLYGAEMHYAAQIEPGILVVHGNGLVVSRAAHIGAGCVLSQNVTIGISTGTTATGERTSGAPHLDSGVHVGPGAVLIGPITIGRECKIAPNVTVSASMPPATIAESAPTAHRPRRPSPGPSTGTDTHTGTSDG